MRVIKAEWRISMGKRGVGVQTYPWFDEANPKEGVQFIKDCGFTCLDYNMDEMFKQSFEPENLTSFFDQDLEKLFEYYRPLKEATEELGVFISQVHGLFPMYFAGEEKKNAYLLEMLKKMMAVCQYLGCKNIVTHPWSDADVHKEEEVKVNLEMYRQLIPEAKKYGVTVCLENVYRRNGMTVFEGACADASEACMYVDTLNAEAGQEVFGFCMDVGHAHLVGRNLYRYVVELGDRLKALHIHENDGSKDAHLTPYTQMDASMKSVTMDWERFLKGLKEIGYEGSLCFETFRVINFVPEKLRKDYLILISAVGKYFRECLEED